jgi:hypothetical protein
MVGCVAFEHLAAGQQHLVGRLAATALAAHAIGNEPHRASLGAAVHQDLDLVLLIGAVSLVEAGCSGQAEGLGSR